MKKQKYKGHQSCGLRDFTKPNFGLRSRQIDKALINASLEQVGGLKNNTHLARLPACREFALFLKQHTAVKRLNHIDKSHVQMFGEYLRERFEAQQDLTSSTARDYLSHINVCLKQARGDEKLKVLATKELDYPPKSGIATQDGAISDDVHHQIVTKGSVPVSVMASLQRSFGLRMREAALLDCQKAFKECIEKGYITVKRGTKGGQAREVPSLSESQKEALVRGCELQSQTGHDNLVPASMSFKSFQYRSWREHKRINPNYLSHGERKHFACQFYQSTIDALPPIKIPIAHGRAHHAYLANELGLSVPEARALDNEVRMALSKLLGHHRITITAAYIG
ncbi:integrase domain-containing protein [Vibrio sp. B1Z05]|uniref:integrase domain-containing protein n=1 Tax=Vibrio sp. B1Z05 TaxID=2654980 RepID=UPI00128C4A9B|nr:integrase domain-containing protein [Vibrio sp. B1Z05]MPW37313.1 hypothetical protein [Vibrio sp. B1Z05]